jgi:hypothetical protein
MEDFHNEAWRLDRLHSSPVTWIARNRYTFQSFEEWTNAFWMQVRYDLEFGLIMILGHDRATFWRIDKR